MSLADFFKEVDNSGVGKYSISRLVYFLSFFPAAYHVFMTGQDMSMFVTTYTAGYLGGKHGGNLIDAIGSKSNAENTIEPTK